MPGLQERCEVMRRAGFIDQEETSGSNTPATQTNALLNRRRDSSAARPERPGFQIVALTATVKMKQSDLQRATAVM